VPALAHFSDKLVPVARSLPSNSEYLEHLRLSSADQVVRLASNENTDPPSELVREALAEAFELVNFYPPPIPPLASELAVRHGVGISQILVTAGSTEVIDATLRTFVRAGDEVVIPAPSWPVYRRRLTALEARIVEVALQAGQDAWSYDPDRFLAAIGPLTKLVVLCTPNNPTGNAMALADVKRIAATGVPLLIDGAYCDFDPDNDPGSLIGKFANVVLTRTFSKAYSLAGLRLGYALGSRGMLGYVERFLVPGTAVSSVALHAGRAALRDEAHYQRQLARIAAERERVLEALRAAGLPVWRSSTNFVSVDAAELDGGAAALAAAIRAHGVVVRPLGDLVRISIGRAAENDALITAARSLGLVAPAD
jgi:histidinol-phosphate aminotransferase